jgi:hypothetical protein
MCKKPYHEELFHTFDSSNFYTNPKTHCCINTHHKIIDAIPPKAILVLVT